MIFSGSNHGRTHISMIIAGDKTWTRRLMADAKVSKPPHYKVGHIYSIQPRRTKPGIPDGRVLILDLKVERINTLEYPISVEEAWLEGGYTPVAYEKLFRLMYNGWRVRAAYELKFVPTVKI